MSKQLIPAFTTNPNKHELEGVSPNNILDVSEFFYDTIQGEGVYVGVPAVFLRLKGCTLNCTWCDTTEVWRAGDSYSFDQLFNMIDDSSVREKLANFSHHLVITGGSPLMQQYRLIGFISQFKERFGFIPFIEIEDEMMIRIDDELDQYVSCWNHSPKLESSGNFNCFNPKAFLDIRYESGHYYKFVISDPDEDWKEIQWLLENEYIQDLRKIVLMPEGQTREELVINAPKVVELAIAKGTRFSNREHVVLWNKKTGI